MTIPEDPKDIRRTSSKRAYTAPKLSDYGSIAKITQAGSFLGNDGNTKCVGNAGDPNQCTS